MNTADLRRRVEHSPVGEMAQEFVRLRAIDRSLALASKLFVAVIPLSIILSALGPRRDSFGEAFSRRFGLTGLGAQATRTLFAANGQVKSALSVIGVLILVYSMFSFTRGLQHFYLDAWRLSAQGRQTIIDRGYWVGVFILYTLLIGPLRDLENHGSLSVVYFFTITLTGIAFWAFTPWLLLDRRVPWRRLVPTGALTSAFSIVFMAGSELTLPRIFTQNAERYGLIGIAFGLVTWLFVYAASVLVAAVIGSVWDRHRFGTETRARDP